MLKYLNKGEQINKMVSKKRIILSVAIALFLLTSAISVNARELKISIIDVGNFSDIWLGISTGGYKLIAEKGSSYTFRIFIKNGMANRSLNNVELSPNSLPFNLTSITPRSIEQLKPMEIRIYYVNVSIPGNTETGKYPIKFDIASNEFPRGVFSLESEIKVVRKINTWVYVIYVILIVAILGLLFYRKLKQSKE
jgi:uncharacterized membrane protein